MENPVLDSTRILIQHPQYVSINNERMNQIAEEYAQQKIEIPTWDFPPNLNHPNPRTVQDFIMLENTINFAFTDFTTKQKFTTEYQGQEWRGSIAMVACLTRAFESGIPILEGSYLKSISERDMALIFRGNMEIPMFDERLAIFREVGEVLCNKYGGNFHTLIEQSEDKLFNKGEGLVEKLVQDFPSFNDSVQWNGQEIKFYKRAQLAPAIIYGRFQGTPHFNISDINELTVFADYVLPKALRDLGILEYSAQLAEKVDGQKIILANSQQELEIRASTIHASQILIEAINQKRRLNPINALHLDAKLWSESRKPEGTPHHLTPTIAY